jgi:hypothetical protein
VQALVQARVRTEGEGEGSHEHEEDEQSDFHTLSVGTMVDKHNSSYD